MSFLATAWVEEAAPTADVYERLILMCMAARADQDGSGVYRSIRSLARSCHCDEETVKRRFKAMLKRKLIALGDQSRAAHIDKRYRPKVYDLLIPYEWFSEQQLAQANRERTENGRPPLTREDRPPIASPPSRQKRADKGVPNPKRSPKKTTTPLNQGALSEPPTNPVDNFSGGSLRAASGGSLSLGQGALSEPQIRPYESVPEVIRPSGTRASANEASGLPSATAPDVSETDGRTDDPSKSETVHRSQAEPAADVAGGSRAADLVSDEAIRADLCRIDLLPAVKRHQQQQLAQLVAQVDRALLRFPEVKVARYLADKAREANTVKFLLTAFTDYSDAIRDVPTPSGASDGRRDEDLLDSVQRIAADTAERSPTSEPRKPAAPAPTPPPPDLSSPVSWLTDQQFAALSAQDRAHVRAAGDTPAEELRPVTAKRVTAIRRAAAGVAA